MCQNVQAFSKEEARQDSVEIFCPQIRHCDIGKYFLYLVSLKILSSVNGVQERAFAKLSIFSTLDLGSDMKTA